MPPHRQRPRAGAKMRYDGKNPTITFRASATEKETLTKEAASQGKTLGEHVHERVLKYRRTLAAAIAKERVQAYNEGVRHGDAAGYERGLSEGYCRGSEAGHYHGYDQGFAEGVAQGRQTAIRERMIPCGGCGGLLYFNLARHDHREVYARQQHGWCVHPPL